MRVVFDTNIFISALVIPGSRAEKAILKIIEEEDSLLISKEIIKEVLSVLSSKFGRDREGLSHVAVTLSELAELVKPARRLKMLNDKPGNRILECAVYGKADLLVTGDKKILQLREYKGVKIISLKEYLEPSEAWLFQNGQAMRNVKAGLRDASEGKISKLNLKDL
jgi:putative PIN family toxin of toxin-antitoxin system